MQRSVDLLMAHVLQDMKRAVAQLDESASVLRKQVRTAAAMLADCKPMLQDLLPQGKQLAALGMMERALEMRARLHGLDSPEVRARAACQALQP